MLTSQLVFGQTEQAYYAEVLKKFRIQDFPVVTKCEPANLSNSLKWGVLESLPEDLKSNILRQFQESDQMIGSCHKYVTWSCGSPCQMMAVFKVDSGELVGTLNSSLGFLTASNSRLIITNPPTKAKMNLAYRELVGPPGFYQLCEGKLIKIEE